MAELYFVVVDPAERAGHVSPLSRDDIWFPENPGDEYSTYEWFTRAATPLTRCPSPAHARGVRRAAGCSACGKRTLSDVFVADGGGPNTE